jgi:CheY-like chemotaxis protein
MPRPLRILSVEDHVQTSRSLATLLGRRGHTVVCAGTAEQALASLADQDFDLVICDIGLPDMNGWDLLVEMKIRLPRLQAIALTGYGYPGDYDRSAQAGFVAHITKPVEMASLDRMIARHFPEEEEPATW